jgi:hypothetical protein
MGIVICVEMSEKSKSELDELMTHGSYKSYSEAVTVAISNQLILQRQTTPGGVVVVGLDVVPQDSTSSQSERAVTPSQLPIQKAPVSVPMVTPTQLSTQKAPVAVPMVFSLSNAQSCQSEPASLPDDVFSKNAKVTPDRWSFGQHNKLLPVKASCRGLASLLAERPLGVPLLEATSRLAKEAALLGDYLRHLDERSGGMREEALATAFPNTGEDSDRSRLRYANQFIASLNAQNQLSGLLVDLKLINLVRGKEPLLLLTGPGLHFAKLPNPILDEPLPPNSNGWGRSRFTDDEIEFLISHIKEHVPAENYAFRMVLGAMVENKNTPELLDTALKYLWPIEKKPDISDAFITTQRSGVIARMSDLGLVTRHREGPRVRYEATSRGVAYIGGKTGAQNA